MIENEIQVVDDFFPKYEQKLILQHFLDEKTDWYYKKSISSYKKETDIWAKHGNVEDTDGFFKRLEVTDPFMGKYFDKIKLYTLQKFNVNIESYLRVMRTFYPPNPLYKNNYIMTPHVDQFIPHKNLLYYVNDNDAPTIFFNQKFENFQTKDYSKQEIIKKVIPKQGRAVLFNGHIFHCASVSKLYSRMTINTNFI